MTLIAKVAIGVAPALGLVVTLAACLYSIKLRRPSIHRPAAVTLILPVTSISAERLHAFVQALDGQTMKPRRVVLAIESDDDPAFAAARTLSENAWHFDLELIIAGPALRCSQKCWNLMAAARRLTQEDDAVVLADADIQPTNWWLSALVSPLIDGQYDMVTGYRWPVIAQLSLGGSLVAAIDRTIAILPRPRGMALAWGGSLALTRSACARLALPELLGNSLSDDLTIAASASKLGLRVLCRRALLVPTPVTHSLASAWAFARRQYCIIRVYRPAVWFLALSASSAIVISWGSIFFWLPHLELARTSLVLTLALGLIKTHVLADIGDHIGVTDRPVARLSQYGLISIKPLVDLFHLGVILLAAQPRTLTWGHVTYRIAGADRITVLERRPWSDSGV